MFIFFLVVVVVGGGGGGGGSEEGNRARKKDVVCMCLSAPVFGPLVVFFGCRVLSC